jgi:hypothetical protein
MIIASKRMANSNCIYARLKQCPSEDVFGKKAGNAVCRYGLANACKDIVRYSLELLSQE